MHQIFDALPASSALFHSRAGGFPLFLCTYALLDEHSNDTTDQDRIAVVRVTALNGERFRLRDPGDIRRFLTAVGHSNDEVLS